jgi:hypothetical protein
VAHRCDAFLDVDRRSGSGKQRNLVTTLEIVVLSDQPSIDNTPSDEELVGRAAVPPELGKMVECGNRGGGYLEAPGLPLHQRQKPASGSTTGVVTAVDGSTDAATKKHVASRTLKSLQWNNSSVLGGDIVSAITALKVQPGHDLQIIGSGSLIQTLHVASLIDEYNIWT